MSWTRPVRAALLSRRSGLPPPQSDLILETAITAFGGADGDIFDIPEMYRRGQIFADAAGTIQSGVGDPVRLAVGLVNEYVAQGPNESGSPVLQTDGERWWLAADGTQYLDFTLDTVFGDEYLWAGAELPIETWFCDLVGKYINDDTAGQSSLSTGGATPRHFMRVSGARDDAQSPANIASDVPFVTDGAYESGGHISRLNGAAGSKRNFAKIGNNRYVRLLARAYDGGYTIGRGYSLGLYGGAASAGQKSCI